MAFDTIDALQQALASSGYVADRALATAVFLALKLGRPLLLEGEAGVGKTEVAKTLATLQGRRLIRLQCYEGLDAAATIYEWNYTRQLLQIRLAEVGGAAPDIYAPEFLIRRPLLQAIEASAEGPPPLLLIDEIDRADEEFEAFLLEFLSDFQVSIPEIGTVRATRRPFVVLTSNRSRELSEALKRRCLHLQLDYPSPEVELEIVRLKAPGIREALAADLVQTIQRLRTADLRKAPSIGETLDWAQALVVLGADSLSRELIEETLSVVIKYDRDAEKAIRALDLNGNGPAHDHAHEHGHPHHHHH